MQSNSARSHRSSYSLRDIGFAPASTNAISPRQSSPKVHRSQRTHSAARGKPIISKSPQHVSNSQSRNSRSFRSLPRNKQRSAYSDRRSTIKSKSVSGRRSHSRKKRRNDKVTATESSIKFRKIRRDVSLQLEFGLCKDPIKATQKSYYWCPCCSCSFQLCALLWTFINLLIIVLTIVLFHVSSGGEPIPIPTIAQVNFF